MSLTIHAVLGDHPDYTVNRDGDRIRCNGPECRTVLDLCSLTPGQVFTAHLKQELVPLDEELARLRRLLSVLPALAGEMNDLNVPLHILADLDQLMREAGFSAPAKFAPKPEPAPAKEPAAEAAPVQITPPPEPKEETPTMPVTRRDTKELTETLATVKAGDRVRASFKMPRYGDFTVEGTVVKGKGSEHRQFNIGGSILGTNGKPSKFVQEMVVLASAGNHNYAIVPGSEDDKHFGQAA